MFGTPVLKANIRRFAALLAFEQTLANPVHIEHRLGPLEWSRRYARIRTADGRNLAFKDVERDYQTAILSDKSKRQLILKSRQLGISQTYAFKAAEEAIAGGTALIISKSLEQAALFLEYVYTAMQDSPHPDFISQNKYSCKLANGGAVICQPATKKAGRGIPATLVIIDEFAWQEYAREILVAVIPTLSTTDGDLVILSTPNGMGNPFEEITTAALDPELNRDIHGQPIWSVHVLPWSVHPDWDEAWAVRQRQVMGIQAFAQEHDIDFVASGTNLFNPKDIDYFMSAASFPGPIPGHRYVSGFDLGRERDAFTGWVLDISTSPFTVAHFEYHEKLSYVQQAKIINGVRGDFPGTILVESNGVGDPFLEFLEDKYNWAPEPWLETHTSKKNIIDALMLALERRWLRAPVIPVAQQQLRRYLRNDKKLAQDTVMALAIAVYEAGQPVMDVNFLPGGKRTTINPNTPGFGQPTVVSQLPGVTYVGQ